MENISLQRGLRMSEENLFSEIKPKNDFDKGILKCWEHLQWVAVGEHTNDAHKGLRESKGFKEMKDIADNLIFELSTDLYKQMVKLGVMDE